MRPLPVLLLPLLCALPAGASPPRQAAATARDAATRAVTVGFARATDAFEREKHPARFQALHLLDGDAETAWCTASADPLEDSVSFGFKRPVRLDALRVSTGRGGDAKRYQAFSRARRIRVQGGPGAGPPRELELQDRQGPQELVLDPPLEATYVTLRVLDVFPSEDPEAPTCVSDVVFASDGRALNGRWMADRLFYGRSRAPLLGTWFAGDAGVPDHALSFFVDGTYRFLYEPYGRPEAREELSGRFTVVEDRLTLELPGKGRVALRYRQREEGGAPVLSLDGSDKLPERLRAAFRSAP